MKTNYLDRLVDRVLLTVSPATLKKRLYNRELCMHNFSYEGATPGRQRRLNPYTETASSETPRQNWERQQLIAEARVLEQNFPFVGKILALMEDYVLGDFKVSASITDPEDKKAVDAYWENWCSIADFTGKDHFNDLTRLVLRSVIRDGDILGKFCGTASIKGEDETINEDGSPTVNVDNLQIQLIEADRIGAPLEAQQGNGYLSGVLYDPSTGAPTGYRVYDRDPLSQAYTNPTEVPVNAAVHVRLLKRADSLRGITEFASVINTMHDIKDILDNEKIAVKWASSQTAVVTKMLGEADAETVYNDPVRNYGGIQDGPAKSEQIVPGTINYLSPGEKMDSFKYDRASPSFTGLLDLLYRECCSALGIPFGFLITPSGNGTAVRQESQQAKRTIERWQRLIKHRWIVPIRARVLLHAISTGQLKIKPATMLEIHLMKISWPAHPTVDAGRESAANCAEYQLGLKSAESIFRERGEDWEQETLQIAREQDLTTELTGAGANLMKRLGPNALTSLAQVMSSVGNSISIEQASVMLTGIFGIDEKTAKQLLAAPPLPPPPEPKATPILPVPHTKEPTQHNS